MSQADTRSSVVVYVNMTEFVPSLFARPPPLDDQAWTAAAIPIKKDYAEGTGAEDDHKRCNYVDEWLIGNIGFAAIFFHSLEMIVGVCGGRYSNSVFDL